MIGGTPMRMLRVLLLLSAVLSQAAYGATLVSVATGDFTSSSTWAVVDSTSELDSEASGQALNTGNTDSAVFQPGAIEIYGICVKVSNRGSGSPSNTMRVGLYDSTGASEVSATFVSFNVSDIAYVSTSPLSGYGWYCTNFAPVTLSAATDYKVRVSLSATTTSVTLYRNGTSGNVSRELVTTTIAAPGAADKLIVAGYTTAPGTNTAVTVTNDNTATTSFGPTVSGGPPQGMTVNNRGTLAFGTTASTNYYLKLKGILQVFGGGTFTVGTSGTRMPATSSGTVEFDVATNSDSGLVCNGTCSLYGATKTATTLLTADAAGSATVLTLSTAGWAEGDLLGIASTTRTYSETETKTIQTVDSGTQVTLTSGLSAAHSGTAPTQAEVGNLTRNVRVIGTSATLRTYIYGTQSGTLNASHAEFAYLGGASTSGQEGFMLAAVSSTGGASTVDNCALHDFGASSGGVAIGNSPGPYFDATFINNVVYGADMDGYYGRLGQDGAGEAWTVTGNLFLRNSSTIMLTAGSSTAITFGSNTVAGSAGSVAIELDNYDRLSYDAITVHSNAGEGFRARAKQGGTISNLTAWRNTSYGLCFGNSDPSPMSVLVTNCTLFGNGTANINIAPSSSNMVFKDCAVHGDTSYSTPRGMQIYASNSLLSGMQIINSDFGTPSGIKASHSTADIGYSSPSGTRDFFFDLVARDSAFGSATVLDGRARWLDGSHLSLQRWDGYGGITNHHKSWYAYGTVEIDSSTYRTAAPSEKLTPDGGSGNKLKSSPKRVAVDTSTTVTPHVWVYKSAAYNGAQPRLIVHDNAALGIDADSVLDTATGGTGSWEELTGTTATVTDNGVLEFVVDCDGTAGVVYTDDWTAN